MKRLLEMLPETVKNLIIFVLGIVLLIYTMGFFTDELNRILMIVAILMIIYGFISLDGPGWLMSLFSNNKNTSEPSNNRRCDSDSRKDNDDLF